MNHRVPIVVAVVAGGLLVSALASGGESAEESEYVGAASCAQCHQSEFQSWQQSAHARALERLSETEQKDPRCRQCHTTSPEEVDPALAGVQCESCHGRGRYYSPRWVMKDPVLRGLLFFEKGGAETCARCHNDMSPNLQPFVYDQKWKLIAHGHAATEATPPAAAQPAPTGATP